MSIIVFLIVFSIIVTIHEFGHYYVAKKSGVLVREFALGMGPKLFALKRGETTFTIRALPLGGFVRMAGYDDTNDQIVEGQRICIQLDDDRIVTMLDTQDTPTTKGLLVEVVSCDAVKTMQLHATVVGSENSEIFTISKKAIVVEKNGTMVQVSPLETHLESASVWKRIAIYAAGPICNFLLSITIFIILAFANGGTPSSSNVVEVVPNGAAQLAGIRSGERITHIAHEPVLSYDQIVKALDEAKQKNHNVLLIDVASNGVGRQVSVALQDGKLGIYPIKENSFLGNVAYGFTQTGVVIKQVWQALASIVTKGLGSSGVGGPLAIIQASGQVAQAGFMNVLVFLAMLSANLGIINLLIIPGLDGGKILLGLIEVIRRKPLSKDKEMFITMIGAGLLLLLTVAVTFNDIVRLFFK